MLKELIMKIQLALQCHLLIDYFYIKAYLIKIELTKQLFVLELEQGQEVLIPSDLAQLDLPWSYRFYDPIMSNVDARLSRDVKQYYNLQAQYAKNEERDKNIYVKKAMKKLGLVP